MTLTRLQKCDKCDRFHDREKLKRFSVLDYIAVPHGTKDIARLAKLRNKALKYCKKCIDEYNSRDDVWGFGQ